ncbi:MAG: hypothetical protein MHM6MM_004467 [Cercozoa sp. M6MM]
MIPHEVVDALISGFPSRARNGQSNLSVTDSKAAWWANHLTETRRAKRISAHIIDAEKALDTLFKGSFLGDEPDDVAVRLVELTCILGRVDLSSGSYDSSHLLVRIMQQASLTFNAKSGPNQKLIEEVRTRRETFEAAPSTQSAWRLLCWSIVACRRGFGLDQELFTRVASHFLSSYDTPSKLQRFVPMLVVLGMPFFEEMPSHFYFAKKELWDSPCMTELQEACWYAVAEACALQLPPKNHVLDFVALYRGTMNRLLHKHRLVLSDETMTEPATESERLHARAPIYAKVYTGVLHTCLAHEKNSELLFMLEQMPVFHTLLSLLVNPRCDCIEGSRLWHYQQAFAPLAPLLQKVDEVHPVTKHHWQRIRRVVAFVKYAHDQKTLDDTMTVILMAHLTSREDFHWTALPKLPYASSHIKTIARVVVLAYARRFVTECFMERPNVSNIALLTDLLRCGTDTPYLIRTLDNQIVACCDKWPDLVDDALRKQLEKLLQHSEEKKRAWHHLSLSAWLQSEKALLTCPFKYYRAMWVRHMPVLCGVDPNDESARISSDPESVYTELSERSCDVGSAVSRALIKRIVFEGAPVDTNWCRELAQHVTTRLETSRELFRATTFLGSKRLRSMHPWHRSKLATLLGNLKLRSLLATPMNLNKSTRPWAFCSLQHAVRCGIDEPKLNLVLGAMSERKLDKIVLPESPSSTLFLQMPSPLLLLTRWMSKHFLAEVAFFLAWCHFHRGVSLHLLDSIADESDVDRFVDSCLRRFKQLGFPKPKDAPRAPPLVGGVAIPQHLALMSFLCHVMSVKSSSSIRLMWMKLCNLTLPDGLALQLAFCAHNLLQCENLRAVLPFHGLPSPKALQEALPFLEKRLPTFLLLPFVGLNENSLLVVAVVRALQGDFKKIDISRLTREARELPERLKRMHPLCALACARIAHFHASTAKTMIGLTWALFEAQGYPAHFLLKLSQIVMRIEVMMAKVCQACEKVRSRMQQRLSQAQHTASELESDVETGSESDSSSESSESDSSESDSSESDSSESDSSDSSSESDSSDSSSESDSDDETGSSDDESDHSEDSDHAIVSEASSSASDNNIDSDSDIGMIEDGLLDLDDANKIDTTCAICIEDECVDPVTLVACSHVYCRSCITEWAVRKPSCPYCDASLTDGARDAAGSFVHFAGP